MRVLRGLSFLGFSLFLIGGLAQVAEAQELRGGINGIATDSTGAILPGVSVTVAGPALVQPRTVTSGPNGRYRFPSLPSGVYSVTLELDGFQTVRREGIKLTLRRTLKVDAVMSPASLTEEVTVMGDPPIVDVQSTAIGTSFD